MQEENLMIKEDILKRFSNILEKRFAYYAHNKHERLKKIKKSENCNNRISFDRSIAEKRIITGTDEVGRGSIFGPVLCSTVCYIPDELTAHPVISLIDDSKALTSQKRELVFFFLLESSFRFSLGYSTVYSIDKNNILNSTIEAIKRSLKGLKFLAEPDKCFHLIDGQFPVSFGNNSQKIIKGDSRSFIIALASIVAKVIRDYLIIALSGFYPGYFLEKNMGYGTREHFRCIEERGTTELHRVSFLKNYFSRQRQKLLIKKAVGDYSGF